LLASGKLVWHIWHLARLDGTPTSRILVSNFVLPRQVNQYRTRVRINLFFPLSLSRRQLAQRVDAKANLTEPASVVHSAGYDVGAFFEEFGGFCLEGLFDF
jgi:hypothetical protein